MKIIDIKTLLDNNYIKIKKNSEIIIEIVQKL